MINANQLWESGEASFTESYDSFLEVAADVSDLRHAVRAQLSLGDDVAALEGVAEALGGLEVAVADVIAGLEAPDSGQARAEAIGEWLLAVGAFDSLVLGLVPTTTTSSTTTAPTTTSTSLEVATTGTSIPTAEAADSPTNDDGGWILVVVAVGGLAYWLGRRRGPSS